jgi:hypothetical protein
MPIVSAEPLVRGDGVLEKSRLIFFAGRQQWVCVRSSLERDYRDYRDARPRPFQEGYVVVVQYYV